MALRQVVKLGDEILRQRSREITVFDEKLKLLVEDMFETMEHENGVGLAAPQVGLLKRVIVVCVDGKNKYAVINPVITKTSGVQCGAEGCLSVPGQSGYVERPKKLVIEGFDADGNPLKIKADGFLAVAFCHETDHLDGVLFIDKVIDEAERRKK